MKGAVWSINAITYTAVFAVFAVFILMTSQEAVPLEYDREILCALISDSRTGSRGKRRFIQSQCFLFVIVNGSLFDISVFVIIFFSEDITLVIRTALPST